MFEDLQNYIPKETRVSAVDMNTLRDAVRFLRNFFGVNVLNDPDGLAFRKQTRYRDVQLIRVANEQDGQGVWDAWTLLPTTNRSHLDPANNVSLSELFDDNEKIYFYDSRDDAGSYNSPSGTNRVHSFDGEFIPAVKMPFTSGTGTNERRVFVSFTGASSSTGNQITVIDIKGTWTGVPLYKCVDVASNTTNDPAGLNSEVNVLATSDDIDIDGTFAGGNIFSGSAASGTNNIAINLSELGGTAHEIDVTGDYPKLYPAIKFPQQSLAGGSTRSVFVFWGDQSKFCAGA